MKKINKLQFLFIFLFFAAATTFVFQNCSRAKYALPENGSVNTTSIVPGKARIIHVNPLFNKQGADLKVLIVVDDSYTMSQSQTRLSNAIDSLINPLFGRNVQFKVVSTSGIPSNEIDNQITKNYFSIDGSSLSESQLATTADYFIEKTITPRHDRHTPLISLAGFSQTQFNSLKNKLKSAILSVGINGSNSEEGMCPILRNLYDESPNSFFKKGDKTALIVLSDEDDSSSFSTCVSKYQERVSGRPVVYYNYLEQRARLDLEYQVNRDGLVTWAPVTWAIGLPTGQYFNAGQNCNPSDLSMATQIITNRGYVVRNVSKCTYEAVRSTRYGSDIGDDGSNSSKNLCQSGVVFQGVQYSNLYNLIASNNLSAVSGSCEKITQGQNSISKTGIFKSVFLKDLAAFQMQDLKTAFINKSNELFGSGFIFGAIIHKNNNTCALQTGQAYGSTYEDLALKLPNNSEVESLCSSDYSNVLSKVSSYIIESAAKSYIMTDLKSNEKITSVTVKRNGQNINLNSNQFEVIGNTITFVNYEILPGDIFDVTAVSQ